MQVEAGEGVEVATSKTPILWYNSCHPTPQYRFKSTRIQDTSKLLALQCQLPMAQKLRERAWVGVVSGQYIVPLK